MRNKIYSDRILNEFNQHLAMTLAYTEGESPEDRTAILEAMVMGAMVMFIQSLTETYGREKALPFLHSAVNHAAGTENLFFRKED